RARAGGARLGAPRGARRRGPDRAAGRVGHTRARRLARARGARGPRGGDGQLAAHGRVRAGRGHRRPRRPPARRRGQMVGRAVAGLLAGEPVVLPTDTVYGLVANPEGEEWALAALALKGRPDGKPTALLAGSVDALLERLPELHATAGVLRALLPG